MKWSTREALYGELVEQTREAGRHISFEEFCAGDSIRGNRMAYCFGSFEKAADAAWDEVRSNEIRKQMQEEEIARRMWRLDLEAAMKAAMTTKTGWLTPERRQQIIDELVEMYIANDGRFPSFAMIQAQSQITREEMKVLRTSYGVTEMQLQKIAEAKTGRKFVSQETRTRRGLKNYRETAMTDKDCAEDAKKETEGGDV